MKRIIFVVAIIALIGASGIFVYSLYSLGFNDGRSSVEPQIVTVYQTGYVDRHTQTTVYERIPEPYPVPEPYEIEVPVYVDREVYTPHEYKEWTSVNQFIEWYGEQNFTALMPSGVYDVDCDDYSARVQREALKDGYAVSQVLLKGTDYYGVKVRESSVAHLACAIMVHGKTGYKYYYVEPSPWSFKVLYIVRRD